VQTAKLTFGLSLTPASPSVEALGSIEIDLSPSAVSKFQSISMPASQNISDFFDIVNPNLTDPHFTANVLLAAGDAGQQVQSSFAPQPELGQSNSFLQLLVIGDIDPAQQTRLTIRNSPGAPIIPPFVDADGAATGN